ncbi:hypothetical protein ES702_07143 [subsurface metagenome]
MMNIKQLNQYKENFLEFFDILPIDQMEKDIKGSSDSLISELYGKLQYAIDETHYSRYKKIYHKVGICSIYSLMDPLYGDLIRWMFYEIKKSDFDLKAKPPRLWRVNNNHRSGVR